MSTPFTTKKAAVITFQSLWSSYPQDKVCVVPGGSTPENQCAMKMSVCLQKAGVDLRGLPQGCPVRNLQMMVASAAILADWLSGHPFPGCGRRQTMSGQNWQSWCANRTGIIFFEHYWQRKTDRPGGATGNHIDLWNRDALTPGWASFARFWLGISSLHVFGEGFSDLNQSKRVCFFPVM